MNISFDCTATTSSANLTYSIDICAISANCINDYCDQPLFLDLCNKGCANYGRKWSCPPYAPDYRSVSANRKRLFILYARIALAQFTYIKNDCLKIKAANNILKSRADKFLRIMTVKYGQGIPAGSCRLCKPCKCKIDMPCAHPDLMAYSFEAMGIDVGKMVNACFQKPLLWYKPDCLPSYTSVVCGLLTNNLRLTVDDLCAEYDKFVMS
jgi:predicted metal-binding protein